MDSSGHRSPSDHSPSPSPLALQPQKVTHTSNLLPKSDEDQNSKTERLKKSGSSKQKTSRAGAPNYTTANITALLDFVEELEPLGAYHWAEAGNIFEEWAAKNELPKRDQDSLKN